MLLGIMLVMLFSVLVLVLVYPISLVGMNLITNLIIDYLLVFAVLVAL